MKRVLVLLVAAGLVLAPYTASVNAQSSTSKRPPIGQPLVSEGEFADELATALNLTSSHDEAAAEDALASISIAPRNGWISDYPMTPDIIVEVRESTARSASAGSLRMAEAEATGIVDSVSTAMNLPIKVAGGKHAYESSSSSRSSSSSNSGSEYESSSSFEYQSSSSSEYQSSSGAPPPEFSDYVEPTDVEAYYNDYGPPIVSYYPPPWGYSSLYAWVPWPFWWGGFGFGGFFILNDFDRHDHFHHFSNHVTNANGRVSTINAVTRATGTGAGTRSSSTLAGASRSTQGSRLSSSNARPSASAVMNRLAASRGANTAGASAASRNFASSGSSRNMGNTNGAARNSATANQIMNRLASTSHTQVMSPAAVARSASSSGRSFSSTASSRSSIGGYRSYGGGLRSSGGSFRGSGGGFHGGGGNGGGGNGGGGHGGGGHR